MHTRKKMVEKKQISNTKKQKQNVYATNPHNKLNRNEAKQ